MIKVYITETKGIDEPTLKAALELLPQWRREYVCKQKNLSDRINGAFSYLLLQKLTEDGFGVSDTAPFTYGEHGKPYFSASNVKFSISHCRNAAAAAVSEYELGLDIMDNREISEKLASHICSDREMELFESLQDKQFFLRRLWCEKESLSKLDGNGFTKGFKVYDITQKGADFFIDRGSYILALSGKNAETAQLTELSWKTLIHSP